MKHVLIPTTLDPIARDMLVARGFIVVQDTSRPLSELVVAHAETEALIVRSDHITAAVIDALPALKLVVRAGAGYNTIDTKHARRRGVDVMNTPGANANGVAEEVFALALGHYRHIVRGDISTRNGEWLKKELTGRELAHKTLGIVGLGYIGQLVAKRSSGFEMTLLGYDPMVSPEKAESLGVKMVDLATVFRESDIITLHVPETDETRGMFGRSYFDLMQPGAVLINCARAGVVNEDDLRAVRAEKEIGFCTDVYPADAPGRKSIEDVADLMLPHLGASTREASFNAAKRAAEQLVDYSERGITRFVVNKGVPDGLDESCQQLAYYIAMLARHYLGSEKRVRRIACSFYGGLNAYAAWLLPPVVAGISRDFDATADPEETEQYLKDKGVTYEVREPDDSKYASTSVTIDLWAGSDPIEQVSIRGTIAENTMVVSRINDFDKLYFELAGHALIVVYRDRPGVLAKITGACASVDINIEDIRAPQNSDATKAMAFLRTNRPVPQDVLESIRAGTESEVVCTLTIPYRFRD